MNDLNVIDQFMQTFIRYIDGGFGLLQGDVAGLTSILIGIDKSDLIALVLWLAALVLIVAGAVWAWYRRSPAQAWLLFFAPAAFVATEVAAQITRLLPNLL